MEQEANYNQRQEITLNQQISLLKIEINSPLRMMTQWII